MRSISERIDPKADKKPKVETPDAVGVAKAAGGPNVPPDGENAPASILCVPTGNGGAGDLAATSDADFGEALRMIARLPLSDVERAEAVRRLLAGKAG